MTAYDGKGTKSPTWVLLTPLMAEVLWRRSIEPERILTLNPTGHPLDLSVREIEVPVRALAPLQPLIGNERYVALRDAASAASQKLLGRTVWNVSSTATGGGVAEMLQVLIGYTLDAGLAVRWLVMTGDADFFSITKRIHNRLHGVAGDGGPLGRTETAHYTDIAASNAVSMIKRVNPGDIVLLHDPQTAGMAIPLAEAGAVVVWRCHVGRATTNEWTDQAWEFLRHHVDQCEAFVFSLRSYIPSWIDESCAWVIPPSIDPFSPKNQQLARADLTRILRRIGLLQKGDDESPGSFIRRNGTVGSVERRASILSFEQSLLDPGVPLVTQVSRWDRLKDMNGVMTGFASHVAGSVNAHLALVGPSIGDVTDDPEEADVFAECVAAWHELAEDARRRVTLVTLPMDDIDENAAMVNALQCHSTAIVQKSLEEGFGLTVAEAMWKAKAVVASNVGGIAEQIAPGTGVLLEDPADLDAFGRTLAQLLRHPEEIAELGAQARRHVREGFLGDKHLMRYASLIEQVGDE